MPGLETIKSVLAYELFGNTVTAWGIALAVLLVAAAVLSAVRRVIVGRARRLAAKDRGGAAELVINLAMQVSWLAVLAIALRLAVVPLELAPRALQVVQWVVVLAVAWQAAIWARIVVAYGIEAVIARRVPDEQAADRESLAMSMGVLKFLANVGVYTLVAVVALQNLGVNVTALVTGLGVGGIAVALAVQNVVKDLFASLSITLDKPFVAGDFIIVGDMLGTVERIGIKTTRVRSLSGEQLVFGNDDLLSSRIRNYKRMAERRIVFAVGVIYQTPLEKVRLVPGIIREAIEAQEQARFDRAHFKQFGASSLDFEAVYYVLKPDYNVYMDTQQAINLQIYRRFEEEGIDFAYPTQTIHLAGRAEPAAT